MFTYKKNGVGHYLMPSQYKQRSFYRIQRWKFSSTAITVCLALLSVTPSVEAQADRNGQRTMRFIQVKSFDNHAETEAYIQNSPIPLTAYRASNGWYAIVLSERYPQQRAASVMQSLKAQGRIPDDSLLTSGASYGAKACCDENPASSSSDIDISKEPENHYPVSSSRDNYIFSYNYNSRTDPKVLISLFGAVHLLCQKDEKKDYHCNHERRIAGLLEKSDICMVPNLGASSTSSSHQAFSCRSTTLALQSAIGSSSPTQIEWGDDSSRWANDGECDDPRFEGKGMALSFDEVGRFRDATDCRTQFEAGRITLSTGTGDDPQEPISEISAASSITELVEEIAAPNCKAAINEIYEWASTNRYGEIESQKVVWLYIFTTPVREHPSVYNGMKHVYATIRTQRIKNGNPSNSISLQLHCVFDNNGNVIGIEHATH